MIDKLAFDNSDEAKNLLNPPPSSEREVNCEYTLKPHCSSHEYYFCLFNNHFLEVKRSDKKSSKATCFHIGLLEAKPKIIKKSAWIAFTGALVSALAALLIGLEGRQIGLALATGLMSSLLFWFYYYSYNETSLFYSRSGKIPLLRISHRCKGKKQLKAFVAQLKDNIEKNTLPASSQYFAEETHWHKELMEQGWISLEDYEKAKKRIFKQFRA